MKIVECENSFGERFKIGDCVKPRNPDRTWECFFIHGFVVCGPSIKIAKRSIIGSDSYGETNQSIDFYTLNN